MPWEALLGLAVGAPIIIGNFVDSVRERRRRLEYEDFFVPLVGAYLRVTGGRFWRYEAHGTFRGRPVRIACAPLTGSRTTLAVTELSTPLPGFKAKGWNPPALELDGRTYLPVNGGLTLYDAETIGKLNERGDRLAAVEEELEKLLEVAGRIESGELVYEGLAAR